MMLPTLVCAHVILTTAGYAGLIANNLSLLLLCLRQRADLVLEAVPVWRRSAQLFGPMLGTGILFGFWLASVERVPLLRGWLLAAYGLIVLGLALQAAVMIPWQSHAEKVIALGARPSTRPIVVVLSLFVMMYVSIVALMVVRPG